jgi:hypothetical protein
MPTSFRSSCPDIGTDSNAFETPTQWSANGECSGRIQNAASGLKALNLWGNSLRAPGAKAQIYNAVAGRESSRESAHADQKVKSAVGSNPTALLYGHLVPHCLLVLHLQNSVHQNCVKIKRGPLYGQLAFTLVVQCRTKLGHILVVSLHIRRI